MVCGYLAKQIIQLKWFLLPKMLQTLLFITLFGRLRLTQQTTAPNGCGTENLNLTKTQTSQSSTYVEALFYGSHRAVDGDPSTCSNSKENEESWWRIDLKGVYSISCISIYNKDADHSDITGAQIFIGNLTDNNGLSNPLVQNITAFTKNQNNVFPLNPPVVGRYITVWCSNKQPTILCEVNITGTLIASPFILIEEKKTWDEALYYCREHHSDLASILDDEDQVFADLAVERADPSFVWLGLHYTCALQFWFWVDDNPVEFQRWTQNNMNEGCDMSSAMKTDGDHSWHKKSDYDEYSFICAL